MHEEIKKFSLNGEISDSNIVQAKERMVFFLETFMREKGCVPSIDLEPQFTLDYVPAEERYDFILTVYGVEIGEDSLLWQISGVTNGKIVMKSTPSPK